MVAGYMVAGAMVAGTMVAGDSGLIRLRAGLKQLTKVV